MEASEHSPETQAGLDAGEAKSEMTNVMESTMAFSQAIAALKEQAIHDSDEDQGEALGALAERAEGVAKGIGTLATELNSVIAEVGKAIGDEEFSVPEPEEPPPPPPPEM